MADVAVCFVCLGNICRSPTAEGIMLHLVREAGLSERIHVDSAGTGAYHVGEPADARSSAEARRRGVVLPSTARQFTVEDFERFDYVLVTDAARHADLVALAPHDDARARIHLLRAFDPGASHPEVPDPYYGGPTGFADVYDMCEAACRGLLARLIERHGLR